MHGISLEGLAASDRLPWLPGAERQGLGALPHLISSYLVLFACFSRQISALKRSFGTQFEHVGGVYRVDGQGGEGCREAGEGEGAPAAGPRARLRRAAQGAFRVALRASFSSHFACDLMFFPWVSLEEAVSSGL